VLTVAHALNGVRARLGRRSKSASGSWRAAYEAAAGRDVDVDPGTPVARGRLHLLTQIRREIEDIFLGMGYEVWDGPEVVTVWENFDATPTRAPVTVSSTRSIRRRHDPAHSDVARPDQGDADQEAADHMVSPGRVYRRDTRTTHSPTFQQVSALPSIAGSRSPICAERQRYFRQLFGPDHDVRMHELLPVHRAVG
jgi:phenylalanyl-tRNA synthetase alpha chain